jgi:hypothetical protein
MSPHFLELGGAAKRVIDPCLPPALTIGRDERLRSSFNCSSLKPSAASSTRSMSGRRLWLAAGPSGAGLALGQPRTFPAPRATDPDTARADTCRLRWRHGLPRLPPATRRRRGQFSAWKTISAAITIWQQISAGMCRSTIALPGFGLKNDDDISGSPASPRRPRLVPARELGGGLKGTASPGGGRHRVWLHAAGLITLPATLKAIGARGGGMDSV